MANEQDILIEIGFDLKPTRSLFVMVFIELAKQG